MGMIPNFVYDLCTDEFVRFNHIQPVPTGQITENVFAVRTGTVNLFLYRKGQDCIAIDSGFGPSILKRELMSLKINPGEISGLFLTHSDFDHAGGLSVLGDAQIYLSAQEEPMITRKTARKDGVIYNRKIRRKYRLLHENDKITVGAIKVRAIETPGHTPGSMSYLIDDKDLFVGDAFKLIDGKACPVSPFYCMDAEKQEESLKKLAKLKNIRFAFTAHRGYTKNFSDAMSNWI